MRFKYIMAVLAQLTYAAGLWTHPQDLEQAARRKAWEKAFDDIINHCFVIIPPSVKGSTTHHTVCASKARLGLCQQALQSPEEETHLMVDIHDCELLLKANDPESPREKSRPEVHHRVRRQVHAGR